MRRMMMKTCQTLAVTTRWMMMWIEKKINLTMQVSPSNQASLLPLLTDTTTSVVSHTQPLESSPSFPEPHAIPSQPASHQSHDPTQPILIPSHCGRRIIVEATEAMIKSTKRKCQSCSELGARVAALEEESRFQRQLIELYGMHVDMT